MFVREVLCVPLLIYIIFSLFLSSIFHYSGKKTELPINEVLLNSIYLYTYVYIYKLQSYQYHEKRINSIFNIFPFPLFPDFPPLRFSALHSPNPRMEGGGAEVNQGGRK